LIIRSFAAVVGGKMLIVAGTIDVDPAERAEFLRGRAEAILAAREEAGCIEYTFSADAIDPGRVRIFERWRDRQALAVHLEAAGRAASSSSSSSSGPPAVKILGRDLTQYVISESGPLGS
jgi:quinol monooxygenase YgiN